MVIFVQSNRLTLTAHFINKFTPAFGDFNVFAIPPTTVWFVVSYQTCIYGICILYVYIPWISVQFSQSFARYTQHYYCCYKIFPMNIKCGCNFNLIHRLDFVFYMPFACAFPFFLSLQINYNKYCFWEPSNIRVCKTRPH